MSSSSSGQYSRLGKNIVSRSTDDSVPLVHSNEEDAVVYSNRLSRSAKALVGVAIVIGVIAAAAAVTGFFFPLNTAPSPLSPTTVPNFNNSTLVELIQGIQAALDGNSSVLQVVNATLRITSNSVAANVAVLNATVIQLSNTLRQLQIATNSSQAVEFVAMVEQQLTNVMQNLSLIGDQIQLLNTSDQNLSNAIDNLIQNFTAQITSLDDRLTLIVQQLIDDDTQLSIQVNMLSNRVDIDDSQIYHLEERLNQTDAKSMQLFDLLVYNDTLLSQRIDGISFNFTVLQSQLSDLANNFAILNGTASGLASFTQNIEAQINIINASLIAFTSDPFSTSMNLVELTNSFNNYSIQTNLSILSLYDSISALNVSLVDSGTTITSNLTNIANRVVILEQMIAGLASGGNDSTALFLNLQAQLISLTNNITTYVSQLNATDNILDSRMMLVENEIMALFGFVNQTLQNDTDVRSELNAIQANLALLSNKVDAIFANTSIWYSILDTRTSELQVYFTSLSGNLNATQSNFSSSIDFVTATIASLNVSLLTYLNDVDSKIVNINNTFNSAVEALWNGTNDWVSILIANDSALSTRIDNLSQNQTSIWDSLTLLQQQLLFATANNSNSSLSVSSNLALLQQQVTQLQVYFEQNVTQLTAMDSQLESEIQQLNVSFVNLGATLDQTRTSLNGNINLLFSLNNDTQTRDLNLQNQITSLMSQLLNMSTELASTQQWLFDNTSFLSSRIDSLNASLQALSITTNDLATNYSVLRDDLSQLSVTYQIFQNETNLWIQLLLTNDSNLNSQILALMNNDTSLALLVQELNISLSNSASSSFANVSQWIQLLLVNDSVLQVSIDTTNVALAANYTALIDYINQKLLLLTNGTTSFSRLNLGNGRVLTSTYFDLLEYNISTINATVQVLTTTDRWQNTTLQSTSIDVSNLQTNITNLLSLISGLNVSLANATNMIGLLFQNDSIMAQFDMQKLQLLLDMSDNITLVISNILQGNTAFTALNLDGVIYTSGSFDAMNQSITTKTQQVKVDLTALIVDLLLALTNGTTQFNAINLNGAQLTKQNFTDLVNMFSSQLQSVLNGSTSFTSLTLDNSTITKSTFDIINTQLQLLSGNISLLQSLILSVNSSVTQLQNFAISTNASIASLTLSISNVNSSLLSQLSSTNNFINGLQNGSIAFSKVNISGVILLPTTISDIYNYVNNSIQQLTNGTTTFTALSFGNTAPTLTASFVSSIVTVRQGSASVGSLLVYNGSAWIPTLPSTMNMSFNSINVTALLLNNVDYTQKIMQSLSMDTTQLNSTFGCLVYWSSTGKLECFAPTSGVSNTTRLDNVLHRADNFMANYAYITQDATARILMCADSGCVNQTASSLNNLQLGRVTMDVDASLFGYYYTGFGIIDGFAGYKMNYFFSSQTQSYYPWSTNVYLSQYFDVPSQTWTWKMSNYDTSKRGFWMEVGLNSWAIRSVFNGEAMRTHMYMDTSTTSNNFLILENGLITSQVKAPAGVFNGLTLNGNGNGVTVTDALQFASPTTKIVLRRVHNNAIVTTDQETGSVALHYSTSMNGDPMGAGGSFWSFNGNYDTTSGGWLADNSSQCMLIMGLNHSSNAGNQPFFTVKSSCATSTTNVNANALSLADVMRINMNATGGVLVDFPAAAGIASDYLRSSHGGGMKLLDRFVVTDYTKSGVRFNNATQGQFGFSDGSQNGFDTIIQQVNQASHLNWGGYVDPSTGIFTQTTTTRCGVRFSKVYTTFESWGAYYYCSGTKNGNLFTVDFSQTTPRITLGQPLITTGIDSPTGSALNLGGGGVNIIFKDKLAFSAQTIAEFSLSSTVDHIGFSDGVTNGARLYIQELSGGNSGFYFVGFNHYYDNALGEIHPAAGKCGARHGKDQRGTADIVFFDYHCSASKMGTIYSVDLTQSTVTLSVQSPVSFTSAVSFTTNPTFPTVLPVSAISIRLYTPGSYVFYDSSGMWDSGTGFPFFFYITGMIKTVQMRAGFTMHCNQYPNCPGYSACVPWSVVSAPEQAQYLPVVIGYSTSVGSPQTATVPLGIYNSGTNGLCITISHSFPQNTYFDLSSASVTFSYITT